MIPVPDSGDRGGGGASKGCGLFPSPLGDSSLPDLVPSLDWPFYS